MSWCAHLLLSTSMPVQAENAGLFLLAQPDRREVVRQLLPFGCSGDTHL